MSIRRCDNMMMGMMCMMGMCMMMRAQNARLLHKTCFTYSQ